MDDENMKAYFFGVFLTLVLGFTLGVVVAQSGTHGRAVDHGCAHYDTQTGDFTWNDERPR